MSNTRALRCEVMVCDCVRFSIESLSMAFDFVFISWK